MPLPPSGLFIERRKFRVLCLDEASSEWERSKTKFIHEAQQYGATAMGDARKNVLRRNQESLVVATASGYLPLYTFNMGNMDKTGENLFEFYRKVFIKGEGGFNTGVEEFIVAFVCDNAKNIVKCGRLLQEHHSIVLVKCAAHSFSLVVKHIFKDIPRFAYYVARMEEISHFFRSTKADEMLAEASQGKSLLRVVDTRFASVVLVALRFRKLRFKLREVVNSERFTTWVASLHAEDREVAEWVQHNIMRDKFWCVFI